jgi:hypothetical protein
MLVQGDLPDQERRAAASAALEQLMLALGLEDSDGEEGGSSSDGGAA